MMKKHTPYVLGLLFLCSVSYLFSATDLAPMSWNLRSDWIDATDPNYGGVGDGVTDDTAAIQAALDDVKNAAWTGHLSVLYLPAGNYRITDTLEWSGYGMMLIGDGRDTVIQWDGAAGGTMLHTLGATRTRFIGIVWQGSPDGTATHSNRAAYGIDHHPTLRYESRTRHENEAFYNFTTAGIRGFGGGGSNGDDPTAETMIWNCRFKNCETGIIVGSDAYNNYQWIIEGCHFEDCGTGIYGGKGKSVIFDCRFENSSVVDISTSAGIAQRVRRCVSVGSNHFFKVIFGSASGSQIIEDCHIDAWTNTSYAVNFSAQGPMQVTDCVFTNPPSTNAPIKMSNSYNPSRLTVGGNYCAEISTLTDTPVNCQVVELPLGARGSNLPSSEVEFLKDTWPADSANILDITQPPYNAAKNDKTVDSSAAIQDAIDDAIAANNGTIVYIPRGYYRIDSSLSLTGGNYTIEGSGWLSRLLWYGTAGDSILELVSPQDIELRQFNLMQTSGDANASPAVPADMTTVAIEVSGSDTTNLVIDGVYNKLFPYNNPGAAPASDGTLPGTVLKDLPSSALIYFGHQETALDVRDSGRATILSKYGLGGQVRVSGSNYAKTGFLGVIASQAGNLVDPSGWDVSVDDNQDLIFGDWYVEQAYNHVQLSRGSGTGPGRVSFSGIKQHCYSKEVVNADNYEGTLFYTGQAFSGATIQHPITQTGTNPLDLILADCSWTYTTPVFSMGTGGSLIQIGNIYKDASGAYSYPADVLPSGWEQSTAEGFDHFRELAWYDLVLRHGVGNFLLNDSVELDEVNPNPTTALGYEPENWNVGGAALGAGSARNVTVDDEGSPFAAGEKSILFTDTTTLTGTRLSLSQYYGPLGLSAEDAAVLKFDFRLNGSAQDNDVWLRSFAGSSAGASLHFVSNGSSASVSASGMTTQALSLDTWYHVEIVLDAPSAGAATAILYLTEWTASGPGSTAQLSLNSFGAPQSSAYSFFLVNQVKAGDSTSIHFDNVEFFIGDPIL
ncbi:glycosyl hydrolase family 28-related protein [Coraliomargarita parva]|uniref:glycosyl hydrolase family 28-related protein n=1 Tax=Coraliomargarita parva TaxID=3014050 RepID=UPI0022B3CD06|nr:glycosyl hydrolase family 28-related protein [Coraliomargarita parva]